jgi:hypothetical protein
MVKEGWTVQWRWSPTLHTYKYSVGQENQQKVRNRFDIQDGTHGPRHDESSPACRGTSATPGRLCTDASSTRQRTSWARRNSRLSGTMICLSGYTQQDTATPSMCSLEPHVGCSDLAQLPGMGGSVQVANATRPFSRACWRDRGYGTACSEQSLGYRAAHWDSPLSTRLWDLRQLQSHG